MGSVPDRPSMHLELQTAESLRSRRAIASRSVVQFLERLAEFGTGPETGAIRMQTGSSVPYPESVPADRQYPPNLPARHARHWADPDGPD